MNNQEKNADTEQPNYVGPESIDWEATVEILKADREALRRKVASLENQLRIAKGGGMVNSRKLGQMAPELHKLRRAAEDHSEALAVAWDEGYDHGAPETQRPEHFYPERTDNPYRVDQTGDPS
jgi:hypothetical protein